MLALLLTALLAPPAALDAPTSGAGDGQISNENADENAGEANDKADEADEAGEADEADETSEPPRGDEQRRPKALDVVLPSGIRVVAVEDRSLPVAAVVLALDAGSRDDPQGLPGLLHVLAHQLQMGNRTLAPGAAIAAATDGGGWAGMAFSATQIRYESLVPLSRLDEVLRAESQRLRAPNVNRALWRQAIAFATKDPGKRSKLAPALAAAVWDDPRLAHPGRRVSEKLAKLEVEEVEGFLSSYFDYSRSTLILVGPETPEALMARVKPLFADLPAQAHAPTAAELPTRSPTPARAQEDDPTVIELPHQRGQTLVWPVSPSAASRAWALALCGTINRQRRGADEGRARLRCIYVDQGQQPTLHLRAAKMDAAALARHRLKRIIEGEDQALLDAQRDRVARALLYETRAPLDLAIYLARVVPPAGTSRIGGGTRFVADLIGAADLSRGDGLFRSVPTLLKLGQAIRAYAPGKAPAPTRIEQDPPTSPSSSSSSAPSSSPTSPSSSQPSSPTEDAGSPSFR